MPMIPLPPGFTGENFRFRHRDSLPLLFGNPPLSAVLVRKMSSRGVDATLGTLVLVSSSGGSWQQAAVSGKLCVSPDVEVVYGQFSIL